MVIAAFLVIYTWPPSARSLTREQARVTGVARRPNTWYEATLVTASGTTLTCRARKNAIAWASRCPIAELEAIVGAQVTVEHSGGTLYLIDHAGAALLGPDAYRSAQLTAIVISGLLLTMAGVALWRA